MDMSSIFVTPKCILVLWLVGTYIIYVPTSHSNKIHFEAMKTDERYLLHNLTSTGWCNGILI